jgi:hypothetical protein
LARECAPERHAQGVLCLAEALPKVSYGFTELLHQEKILVWLRHDKRA